MKPSERIHQIARERTGVSTILVTPQDILDYLDSQSSDAEGKEGRAGEAPNPNRWFLDTEFNDDGRTIDLISIALVCEDGREYYAVSSEFDEVRINDWVKANVLPKLPPRSEWKPRAQIADEIRALLLANGKPELWAYFADYDWVALCQLYGPMIALPKGFPFWCHDLKQTMHANGIEKSQLPTQENEHDALADARWVRDSFRVASATRSAKREPCKACGCNCNPLEQTGGGHRGDCPAYEAECTCYEIVGGHQPGCPYGAKRAAQKARHVTAEPDPPDAGGGEEGARRMYEENISLLPDPLGMPPLKWDELIPELKAFYVAAYRFAESAGYERGKAEERERLVHANILLPETEEQVELDELREKLASAEGQRDRNLTAALEKGAECKELETRLATVSAENAMLEKMVRVSGNYVANAEIAPTEVAFENGRVVRIENGALEVGWKR